MREQFERDENSSREKKIHGVIDRLKFRNEHDLDVINNLDLSSESDEEDLECRRTASLSRLEN